MSAKRVVKMIALLTLGALLVFFSSEWNRTLFYPEGFIEKGKKFGLEIGHSKEIVTERILDRGLIDRTGLGANETGYNLQSCHLHIYEDRYEVQLWVDKSWRKGTICVAFLDGKLARMSWWYNPLAP